jgi:hypothetical protein
MAFFELNSEVQIGNFRFSGVHDIRIRRSVHSYSDTAEIVVPAICKVRKGNSISGYQALADLISDRDPVTISLGYDGTMQTEFRGFVRRRNLSMPLVIECEGMAQTLRLDMDLSGFYEVTTARKLAAGLTTTVDGAPGIQVEVADDLPLENILLNHVNGTELCDAFKRFSQGTLSVFFKDFTTLWMGLLYTPYKKGVDPLDLGSVDLRIGYNTIQDSGLRVHNASDPVQIVYHNFSATGQRRQVLSDADVKARGRKEVSVMNNIGDADTLLKLANEKMYRCNYKGYSGYIDAFLQPFCGPGWLANVTDDRYPERNGAYLIESTEVRFGTAGARRRIEVGPKLGFEI